MSESRTFPLDTVVRFAFVREPCAADSAELKRLWREHELAGRLAKEHARRAYVLSREAQPRLRRIWELQYRPVSDAPKEET